MQPKPTTTTQLAQGATLNPKVERSVQESYDELLRELQVRDRCYNGWVKDGRLTAAEARDRFDRLGSAIVWLERAYKELAETQANNDGSY